MSKKYLYIYILFCLLGFFLPLNAQSGNADEATVLKTLRDITTARAEGDTKEIDRLLSSNYVETDGDGAVYKKSDVLKNSVKTVYVDDPDGSDLQMKIEQPHIFISSATAIVSWLRLIDSRLAGQDFRGRYRVTTVFVKENGRWICVASHDSVVPKAPLVSKFGSLAKFAGNYELAPGIGITIIDLGDRLVAETANPPTSTELFPESDKTFYVKGRSGRHIFELSSNGQVIALQFASPTGSVTRMKRIE